MELEDYIRKQLTMEALGRNMILGACAALAYDPPIFHSQTLDLGARSGETAAILNLVSLTLLNPLIDYAYDRYQLHRAQRKNTSSA